MVGLDEFANEVVAELDVLGAAMGNCFFGEVYRASIVAPDGGAELRGTKFREKVAEPASFLCSRGNGIEFSFIGGEGNGGGAGRAPANEATPQGEAIPLGAVTIRLGVSP
ncbi:hypothetical protein CLOP_g18950 [Closterium sp. NIES-67]|nr:hypothetical protein CLOP_g18950 [Closterium sp. NIES-67]